MDGCRKVVEGCERLCKVVHDCRTMWYVVEGCERLCMIVEQCGRLW